MRHQEIIGVDANLRMVLRERGKLVEQREYHNVFTTTGRNWLSKIAGWASLGGSDQPFTQRRVRWIGVGIGSQLEVTTVAQLQQPALVVGSDFIVTIQAVNFPNESTVEFVRSFATNEISIGTPVAITEAALYVDVNPADSALANEGTEDNAFGGGTTTTLLETVGTNPPVAYKTFEPITKTVDFTLDIHWEFRF